ncbi:TonB-dependent receptor [uncultured Salinisphaera sp.]|mgnify:CR=1 FL=1|uniref:TonB-dependent receptor domain-containing protein n=1 Tax=uncultured Salinisphaera sp. TaxID=359372 RepID=UPI0032B2794F|tara:strand:- start:9703 stop:11625 length:1923 start_codon:yes stop_codon:yes gene_type:complete
MKRHITAGLGLGLAATTGSTWAAPAAPSPSAADLGNVTVTATRGAQPTSETLAATSVITRADIVRQQANSLADLLVDTPSITQTNNGGLGKQTNINLRGTDSDQVLVLVDGVRYGSASAGLAALADFPVSQIERIEIVRGPRSSLYGADAVGGVIQIFTRDGEGIAPGAVATPYGSVSAGTYKTYEGNVGVQGATERSHYNVSVSGLTSDGFDACTGRPFSAPGGGAGCFADQPDDDGYNRVAGSARGGYRFDNGWQLSGHYLRADGDNEYDGTTTDQSDSVQEVYGLDIDAPLTDFWDASVSLARSRDLSSNYLGDRFASRFDTRRDTVSFQNDFRLAAGQSATLGVDHRQDEVTSTVDFKENKRANTGVFGQYQGRYGRHAVQLAARGDDNQAYGSNVTGSATYGYDIDDVYTVTASYGNAFNAPTFNDLYYPDPEPTEFNPDPAPASNPDLEPEESRTAELGLKARPAWGRWSVHVYETRIDDEIVLDADFTPQNVNAVRIRGIEGETTAYVGRWRLHSAAHWLEAKNESDGANAGNDLARRPQYAASLAVDRDLFARFAAGATARMVGSRYNDLENQNELGGYALFGLRGAMDLTSDWQVRAKIDNLFDRDYQTVAFYNQPGRVAMLTLRYAPERF